MSALPPEADMLIVGINVCYVPIADIHSTSMLKVDLVAEEAYGGRQPQEFRKFREAGQGAAFIGRCRRISSKIP
jgi:hypothetical protein